MIRTRWFDWRPNYNTQFQVNDRKVAWTERLLFFLLPHNQFSTHLWFRYIESFFWLNKTFKQDVNFGLFAEKNCISCRHSKRLHLTKSKLQATTTVEKILSKPHNPSAWRRKRMATVSKVLNTSWKKSFCLNKQHWRHVHRNATKKQRQSPNTCQVWEWFFLFWSSLEFGNGRDASHAIEL